MLWRSIQSSLPGNNLLTFVPAEACVLSNKGVEFRCEWCHLATWHLVNDCVWNIDRDEPSTSTPRSNSLIFHMMPCSPEMFFPQWLIWLIIYPSMFLLTASQHLSGSLQALVESPGQSGWCPEQFRISQHLKVPGGLWEVGMQKAPLTTPLTSAPATLDEVTRQRGQCKLSVTPPWHAHW